MLGSAWSVRLVSNVWIHTMRCVSIAFPGNLWINQRWWLDHGTIAAPAAQFSKYRTIYHKIIKSWWGAGMVICLERCARLAYGPADATHCLASAKSRLVLPFWYWLTWVVPDKGPLNECVCVCYHKIILSLSQDWLVIMTYNVRSFLLGIL